MISGIQKILKEVLLSCTDYPEKSVCLTRAEEGQMQALPWASILPETQSLRPVWQWERWETGEKLLKVRRKYQAELPLTLALRRRTPEEVSRDAEAFLAVLPGKILLNDTVVQITPTAVHPEFGAGAMDENTVRISVRAAYGIYGQEETQTIKKVSARVKKAE